MEGKAWDCRGKIDQGGQAPWQVRGDSLQGEVMETWLGMASLDKHKVQLDTWGREGEES